MDAFNYIFLGDRMRNDGRILLFPVDDSPPKPGLYSTTLKRNDRQRALSILCNDGLWFCYLDCKKVANPSLNWREAFGRLYGNVGMQVTPIDASTYAYLAQISILEDFNGTQPTSLHERKSAI